jgi:hypothetical protein
VESFGKMALSCPILIFGFASHANVLFTFEGIWVNSCHKNKMEATVFSDTLFLEGKQKERSPTSKLKTLMVIATHLKTGTRK